MGYLKNVLVIFCVSIVDWGYSQSPPSQAMPTGEQLKLVDSLITVSGFKNYYQDFAAVMIMKTGNIKGWSEEELQRRYSLIDFTHFENSIKNSYAFFSQDELIDLINVTSTINERGPNFVFMDYMLHYNLMRNIEIFYLK